jgi:hypothetical protein
MLLRIKLVLDTDNQDDMAMLATISKFKPNAAVVATASESANVSLEKANEATQNATKAAKAESAKKEPAKAGAKTMAEEEPTLEDIRANVAKHIGTYRDEIKAKLTEFGATNVTTLSKEQYRPFNAFLLTLLPF